MAELPQGYQDIPESERKKAQTFFDMLTYVLTKGQNEVQALHYAPLPSSIDQGALSLLKQFTFGGKGIAPSPAVAG